MVSTSSLAIHHCAVIDLVSGAPIRVRSCAIHMHMLGTQITDRYCCNLTTLQVQFDQHAACGDTSPNIFYTTSEDIPMLNGLRRHVSSSSLKVVFASFRWKRTFSFTLTIMSKKSFEFGGTSVLSPNKLISSDSRFQLFEINRAQLKASDASQVQTCHLAWAIQAYKCGIS